MYQQSIKGYPLHTHYTTRTNALSVTVSRGSQRRQVPAHARVVAAGCHALTTAPPPSAQRALERRQDLEADRRAGQLLPVDLQGDPAAALGWPLRAENCRHAPPSAGTSAAAPVVAALVTLLNDARIAAGKSSLGLLNPLLYSIADGDQQAVFNDITDGHNPGCGSPGFWAGVGWDPVTGVGMCAALRLVPFSPWRRPDTLEAAREQVLPTLAA